MSYLPSLHSVDETLKWMRDSVFTSQDVLVVELDGVVVGYASFTGNEISNMYVLPGYQGRGIGSALLAAVLRSMPSEVELWVFESNVGATRFYGRNGFSTVARTNGDNEEGLPDRLMRRRL